MYDVTSSMDHGLSVDLIDLCRFLVYLIRHVVELSSSDTTIDNQHLRAIWNTHEK